MGYFMDASGANDTTTSSAKKIESLKIYETFIHIRSLAKRVEAWGNDSKDNCFNPLLEYFVFLLMWTSFEIRWESFCSPLSDVVFTPAPLTGQWVFPWIFHKSSLREISFFMELRTIILDFQWLELSSLRCRHYPHFSEEYHVGCEDGVRKV